MKGSIPIQINLTILLIRENTERPITISEGTNTLVGTTKQGILAAYESFRGGERKVGRVPALWDGKTAERIIDHLVTVVK